MKPYQTKQKKLLLDFLQQNSANPLTIEEIAAGLQGETVPGKSTVYRLVNRLVEEGSVRRFSKGNSRHFVYQFLECHSGCQQMHCRCVSCGKLFHMDHTLSQQLKKTLAVGGFVLDTANTTLMGRCKGCGGEQSR